MLDEELLLWELLLLSPDGFLLEELLDELLLEEERLWELLLLNVTGVGNCGAWYGGGLISSCGSGAGVGVVIAVVWWGLVTSRRINS